ncbi:hypothetical protein [Egicoccus sp. AB-alg6-2]|uniref:hypothetical protein n=1 Tax=Egicoccus sp. AB-alg6-2 TaxID=3242692 RepID=UPI00359CC501
MPSLFPFLRRGWAFAPVVIEVARQADRHVRPHVRAWQLAEAVDGWVGRWTDNDGTHWVVFKQPDAPPLQAFPALRDAELARAGRELDRNGLKRHDELPEATAMRQVERVRELPQKLMPGRADDS